MSLKGIYFSIVIGSVLGILLTAPDVQGAFSNYNSILIGDQAAGMGGAYTAMSSDASAVSFYNPAGLAFLKGHSFSGSIKNLILLLATKKTTLVRHSESIKVFSGRFLLRQGT